MNREIKFRYLVGGKLVSYTLYQLIYGFMDKGTLHPEDYRGQFTGCKDKNEVDIYEGDIVKRSVFSYDIDSDIDDFKMVSEISYIKYEGHSFWVDSESFGWEGEGLWDWSNMEVIGNIYENPELLTP